MDNYNILGEEEHEPENPFPEPYNSKDTKIMDVSKSSKFAKINGHVIEYFNKNPETNRFVVYRSMKEATEKVISCVEVLKQQFKEPLYQWNRLTFTKKIVLWQCKEQGPRDIRVTVEVPVVFIAISRDPFPGDYSCMSMQCSSDKDIAFGLPHRINQRSGGKSEKPKNHKGNRKTNEGSKWMKPTPEQRKKEHRDRDQLLRELERPQS